MGVLANKAGAPLFGKNLGHPRFSELTLRGCTTLIEAQNSGFDDVSSFVGRPRQP
jgi:hypothetical protein